MISFREALQKIDEVAAQRSLPSRSEVRRLSAAVGGILAESLYSPEVLPPFDNSAMDGFALVAERTAKATAGTPVRLQVQGLLAAGDEISTRSFDPTTACEIMTGAPVPAPYDAIAKIEDVRVQRDEQGRILAIEITKPVATRAFVRPRGGDLKEGQRLLARGARLGSEHVLALAALGFAKVSTFPQIKVARISTGREIVPHDQTPGPGQIRNSTAPYFASVIPTFDARLEFESTVGDDPAEFTRALRQALDAGVDLILTSGGVSMGKHDYVANVLREFGATVHFHKVAIQPGKPILFATFPNGTALFGLPGNPVSGMVGLRFFVERFLRRSRGQEPEQPVSIALSRDTTKPPGLRQLAKAVLTFHEGRPSITVLEGQLSSMVSPLLEANAWAVLPEEPTRIEAGTLVDMYPLFAVHPSFTPLPKEKS